jgi:hypothetical protein
MLGEMNMPDFAYVSYQQALRGIQNRRNLGTPRVLGAREGLA